jgi:type II secretory pathway pseudopilin PulG
MIKIISIPGKNHRGFTLVEALLTSLFLGILGTAISTVYSSAFQTMNDQTDRMLLDSRLRSRMELLVNTDFYSLSSGSENVTINGKSYTIQWSVTPVDLSGEGTAEATAVKVTVSVSGFFERSLITIMVDHEDIVGKIS